MPGELYEFDPDWCLAPKSTLIELLEHRGMSPTGHGDEVDEVIADVLAIRDLTSRHAEVLGTLFGISEEFWVNFERIYRDGLRAGKTDLTK
jgi:hypothetical protein